MVLPSSIPVIDPDAKKKEIIYGSKTYEEATTTYEAKYLLSLQKWRVCRRQVLAVFSKVKIDEEDLKIVKTILNNDEIEEVINRLRNFVSSLTLEEAISYYANFGLVLDHDYYEKCVNSDIIDSQKTIK